jgi:hypothetical protein
MTPVGMPSGGATCSAGFSRNHFVAHEKAPFSVGADCDCDDDEDGGAHGGSVCIIDVGPAAASSDASDIVTAIAVVR